MRPGFTLSLVLTSLVVCGTWAAPKHWALIAAGSKTYDNYRHQANACHAYQIFRRNGIPKEQIVLMMYDDVAYNHQNPYKGTLINRPGGPDVYKGCEIDYRHWEVGPRNFLHVLKGEKEELQRSTGRANAKVIDSGPEDHIFVTYTDHGAEGLIGFPVLFGDLHASTFQEAIKWMYQNKRYSKMAIYIEACESGSMFQNFPSDMNVFAVSSTNRSEFGYACYYDEKRNVFLSDTFSASWMEDSDRGQLTTETLLQQFNVAYNRSSTGKNKAYPHKFGNLTMSAEVLAQYQAGVNTSALTNEDKGVMTSEFTDVVRADLVNIETLKRRMQKQKAGSAKHEELSSELAMEYQMLSAADVFMKEIAKRALRQKSRDLLQQVLTRGDSAPQNDFCYKKATLSARIYCPGQFTDRYYYAFRRFYVLSKLCNVAGTDDVIDSVIAVSRETPVCAGL